MSDGITDGTYQSKIPEINLKRTTDHKNVYADTAIYQVMATFGAETIQIFEADNKERAQAFIDSIVSNGYLKALNPTLNIVYVNHSIIEDGYYTYSHIYENGQTINFTIYNTPLTYNVADVIQGWQGYVVQFSTDVSHWWYDNHAYAYSADGKEDFSTTFPTGKIPLYIGTQKSGIGYLHDDPKWYDWQPFTGTLSVPNTHTEFSFSTKLWDTIEEIKAIAPINKRNIRNDNWKYQSNETYPFIGGYES